MTEYSFPKCVPGFNPPNAPRAEWRFLASEKPLKQTSPNTGLTKLLKVAASLAFKIWQLSLLLRVSAVMTGLAAVVLLFWFRSYWWGIQILTLGMVAMVIATFVVGKILGPRVMQVVNYRKTLEEFAIGLGMSVLGFAAARLHLHTFDKWYLRWGRLDHTLNAK